MLKILLRGVIITFLLFLSSNGESQVSFGFMKVIKKSIEEVNRRKITKDSTNIVSLEQRNDSLSTSVNHKLIMNNDSTFNYKK